MSVALLIQYAERVGRNILPYVVCPAVQYVSTLYYKLHDFREKKVLNIRCVLFSLKLSCETCLVLRRIQRDIVISVQTSQLEFSRQIFKQYWNIKCREIPYVGTVLFLAFRNFANAPKTVQYLLYSQIGVHCQIVDSGPALGHLARFEAIWPRANGGYAH